MNIKFPTLEKFPSKPPVAVLAAFLLFVLALVPFSVSVAAEVTTRLKLHQDLPAIAQVDVGGEGHSHGDMLAFDAETTSTTGQKGQVNGIIVTVDMPKNERGGFRDRIVQMVFDMGNGNTIVVSGKTFYPANEVEIAKNIPQIRAIIGGTGEYIGARGQASTTRADDGGYTHVLELVEQAFTRGRSDLV